MEEKYIDNTKTDNYINNETLLSQLALLKILCDTYDEGTKDIIALSIATAIRVLLHDTPKSISLLKRLNKKDIEFISTNTMINYNEKVHLGLVRKINVGVVDGMGGESKYWPNCDERYFPINCTMIKVPFEEWWEHEKVFIYGRYSLSRKDLVLSICNKDGGAHFDLEVSKKYDNFRHNWSGRCHLIGTKSGKIKEYDNIPTYAAVRQIAYEILYTFNDN